MAAEIGDDVVVQLIERLACVVCRKLIGFCDVAAIGIVRKSGVTSDFGFFAGLAVDIAEVQCNVFVGADFDATTE